MSLIGPLRRILCCNVPRALELATYRCGEIRNMGFNRRKMGAQGAAAAEKEAAAKRATEAQILEDAGRLIAAWNERQSKRMPMLFSPTIGCALKARHWFLWVRCPACQTTQSVDLRTVDRHPWSAISSLIGGKYERTFEHSV